MIGRFDCCVQVNGRNMINDIREKEKELKGKDLFEICEFIK